MPPSRRQRPSFTVPDDISSLSLPEVRQRLERNERVLNIGLFSSPPPVTSQSPSHSPIPAQGQVMLSSSPFSSASPIAGPSNSAAMMLGTSPTDPVRERLLAAREQLLAREKELLLEEGEEGMEDVKLEDGKGEQEQVQVQVQAQVQSPVQGNGAGPRRRSSAQSGQHVPPGKATSGKRRALETIEAGEKHFGTNGLILPMAQTIALADRDFDAATADQFSAMTLTASSSPKPRRKRDDAYPDRPPAPGGVPTHLDLSDEINRAAYLARMGAFMGYKGEEDSDDDDDNEDDDDEGLDRRQRGVDGMFDFDADDGHYPGEDGTMAMRRRSRREPGTGEEVDAFGEDDEEFAEGNDDYELSGADSLEAGPDRIGGRQDV